MKQSLILALLLLLAACSSAGLASPTIQPVLAVQPSQTPAFTASPTKTPFQPITRTPFPSPTATATMQAPSVTSRPVVEWIWHPAGEVVVPIFVYHHISKEDPKNIYTIRLDEFRRQMQALRDLGYTTISIHRVVDALTKGANLPSRPVVITFDDGYRSVYDYAYPVLKEIGFQATVYLISNTLDKKDYLTLSQCMDLLSSGWEFGSHSQSHIDLRINSYPNTLKFEVTLSKTILTEKLKTDILTFAYPYGSRNRLVEASVKNSGYLAGMGLGTTAHHQLKDLYFLSRIEIQSGTKFETFRNRLPWK